MSKQLTLATEYITEFQYAAAALGVSSLAGDQFTGVLTPEVVSNGITRFHVANPEATPFVKDALEVSEWYRPFICKSHVGHSVGMESDFATELNGNG